MQDDGRDSVDTDRREDLAYGGVCPVCGDGFTNGVKRLKGLEGESIEGVRICVIDPPEETLFHLPEDQTDRSADMGIEGSPLFDDRDQETFRAAVETWGIDAQADMAEEEAAEFIAASKHYARGKADVDELIDELADIRIMQEQLAEFIGRERVERRIQEKMDRLRERLNQSAATATDQDGGDR